MASAVADILQQFFCRPASLAIKLLGGLMKGNQQLTNSKSSSITSA